MRTLNYIIVEIEEAYNNKENGLVVNSTIESIGHINRIAKVLAAPSFTPLKKGDDVVCHHNIFVIRHGIGGQKLRSNYHLEGRTYFVPLTEVYMFRHSDSDWEALRPYVFVKPIKFLDKKIGNYLINGSTSNTHEGSKKLRGTLKYPNDELISKGLKVGDEVIFSNFSEYKFKIDGEVLYKMSTKDILGKKVLKK